MRGHIVLHYIEIPRSALLDTSTKEISGNREKDFFQATLKNF